MQPRIRFNLTAVALALLASAVAIMSALHLLQSDLSVTGQPLSFYVHGPHGWLMPLALTAFGGASIALAILWRRGSPFRPASGWLICFGIGMLLDAIAPADRWFPWQGPVSKSGAIHAAAAVLAPPLLLGAMVEVRRRLRPVSLGRRTFLDALALAYLVGLAASGVSLLAGFMEGASPPYIGLAERLLALAAVGWLALMTGTTARPS